MAGRSWLGWVALAAVVAAYAGSQSPQVAAGLSAAQAKLVGALPGGLAEKLATPATAAASTAAPDAAKQAPSTSGAAAPKRVVPPAPVVTEKVKTSSVPLRLEGVGSVTARTTVAIKARIDGQLMEAVIKEGQSVKKGDVLFRIDSRPFEAALRVAEANLARDKANLEKAKSDMARVGDLAGKGYSPKSKYDEVKASLGALEAAVQADLAAIDAAKLNIEYSVIRSPIDGRAGNLLVHPGNMVKANDTQSLVVVTELAPIYVSFAVPERYLSDVKRVMASSKMTVEVWTPDKKDDRISGELFFMNNVVDTSTGTITLMATFPNTDLRLMPGQFVQASALLGNLDDIVAVPAKAVQIGQKGTYVYVVKEDLAAELRPVTVSDTVDNRSVVKSGLKPGETIVIEGQSRVIPGGKVAPREAGSPATAPGGKPKEQS